MTRERSVDRFRAVDYLKRSEECRHAMDRSFEAEEWTGCVINAIHSSIAAADALCVFKLGLRHAGERHDDAISLFLKIDQSDEAIKKNADHLLSLLKIKTDAEYSEKLMDRKDAELSIKHAERLLDFVKSKMRV